jgi:uncharacterized protein YndB with AHSA1/START domain
METLPKTIITVKTDINAPVEKIWNMWSDPKHIMRWNNASADWHTPRAENDLRPGSRFIWHMAARDGSSSFDFSGIYERVIPFKLIEYILDDGRKVRVLFETNGPETTLTETFDAEHVNPVELQRQGWQSILNNFKRYVETLHRWKSSISKFS